VAAAAAVGGEVVASLQGEGPQVVVLAQQRVLEEGVAEVLPPHHHWEHPHLVEVEEGTHPLVETAAAGVGVVGRGGVLVLPECALTLVSLLVLLLVAQRVLREGLNPWDQRGHR
jgi:hypothetical protein